MAIHEVRVIFEDDDFNHLIEKKGNRSWKDFFIEELIQERYNQQ